MARLAVGMVFGIVVGIVGGAALGLHAQEEGDPEVSTVDDTQSDVVWDELAQCESGGNWHSATNPIYKGGLQFDRATWARHGGLNYAWRADYATRSQQIIVAERTLAVQGWQAWPACSRRLGLRG